MKATSVEGSLACIVKVSYSSESSYLVLLKVFSPKSGSSTQKCSSEKD